MKGHSSKARAHRAVRAAVIAGLAVAASGCTTLSYYGQAVRGHFEIMRAREPLERVISAPETSDALKARLALVRSARRFASDELALPDNASYTTYADLGRDTVVWNVFATPELSLEPIESCFPVSGCLAYRGYFAREDAERFAADLARAGNDVYLGGVSAYSTLGWFDDPIVSPMLRYEDPTVIAIVFHELVHQKLYFPGDSLFNEGLASAVADAGVRRFLARTAPEALARYDRRLARDRAFTALVLDTRRRLSELYAADVDVAAKRAGKAREFEKMRARYESLKGSWGGYDGYDRFVYEDANNARLSSVATYEALVPDLTAILAALGYDFGKFFERMAALEPLAPPARARCIEALAAAAPEVTACDATGNPITSSATPPS